VDKFDGRRADLFTGVGIMADLANPATISEFALGLSRKDYMGSWDAYTTEPRFTFRETRLAEVRAAAERLAGARDTLRLTVGDDDTGQ
jgi:hypothetical protein